MERQKIMNQVENKLNHDNTDNHNENPFEKISLLQAIIEIKVFSKTKRTLQINLNKTSNEHKHNINLF
jgi:hypothetical protein